MEEMAKKEIRSVAQQVFDAYFPAVEQQLSGTNVKLDDYQRQCISNALVVMNDVAMSGGLKNLSEVPRTDLMEIMQQVAVLRLNAFSQPREVYFQTRKKKDNDGKWITTVEMGIEGDGNDAILRNYGHNVAEVYPYWAVREGDEFSYPSYHGVEVDPPCWTPTGTGERYLRVVYPVRFKDGIIRYFIGERADVRANLVAHIANNLMNVTFGIAESRYKATVEQKKQIDERKKQLMALCDGKSLDEILAIGDLQEYISPAWRDGSRERMILRKMRNNVVKAIPKDFSCGMALAAYAAGTEEADTTEVDFREVQQAGELPPATAFTAVPAVSEAPAPAPATPAAPKKAPF